MIGCWGVETISREFLGHPSRQKRYTSHGEHYHWFRVFLVLECFGSWSRRSFHVHIETGRLVSPSSGVDAHSRLARNLCSTPQIRCKMIVVFLFYVQTLIKRHRPFTVQGPYRKNDPPLVPWCPVCKMVQKKWNEGFPGMGIYPNSWMVFWKGKSF